MTGLTAQEEVNINFKLGDEKSMNHQQYIHLQKMITIGEEINFQYKTDEYWISSTPDKKYHLTRVRDSNTQTFSNSETLFKKAKIDGKSFDEIYLDIPWVD